MSGSGQDEFLFLPLGGAGEIGMNLNLYGYGPEGSERWLIVDLGVTFGDGYPPGVDIMMPDPAFIEERNSQLEAIVLTHAHEDHLGAVHHLWDRLRCPIYATPFAAALLAPKLAEADLTDEAEVTVLPLGSKFSAGPFDLEFLTLTHSIPEPNAVVVRTPLGTVMHTGDWKFDPDPVIGETPDETAIRELGDAGVLAMVCDSTNVFEPGESGSEGDLEANLTAAIKECGGKVAVACFATNVARLKSIAKAAEACGRTVVLAGRSLRKTTSAARSLGYLDGVASFADEDDAEAIPDDKVLIVCTGSQGEPRAALARIARNDHPRVSMGKGDTVIFSSRVIPGNEAAIGAMQNNLVRQGIKIVTADDRFIHVSGHPNRDELSHMYQMVRPKIAIPVHGEARHLARHAELARERQIEQVVVAENGQMVRLAPGDAKIIDVAPSGRLAAAGERIVPLEGELVRTRTRALFNGVAHVSIVMDGNVLADEPLISTIGLVENEDEDPAIDLALDAAELAVKRLRPGQRSDDDAVAEAVRIAVRRAFRAELDQKPVTTVHVARI